MKTFILLCIVLFAAIAGFIALNWSALSVPMTLSLGVMAIEMPLGWLMLGLLAGVSVFFLLWIVAAQISAIREARELEVTNDLAREAEANRFSELHQYVAKELKNQTARAEASHQALLAKLSDLQQDLRTAIEESGNGLAAYLGRLEDQIERDHPRVGRRS